MLFNSTIIHLRAATVAYLWAHPDPSLDGFFLTHMAVNEEVRGIQAPLLCLVPSALADPMLPAIPYNYSSAAMAQLRSVTPSSTRNESSLTVVPLSTCSSMNNSSPMFVSPPMVLTSRSNHLQEVLTPISLDTSKVCSRRVSSQRDCSRPIPQSPLPPVLSHHGY